MVSDGADGGDDGAGGFAAAAWEGFYRHEGESVGEREEEREGEREGATGGRRE